MTLKQARAEARSQMHHRYEVRYINFTKDLKYYMSDYPTEKSVYRCYGSGEIVLVESAYAKQFANRKRAYDYSRSKKKKVG